MVSKKKKKVASKKSKNLLKFKEEAFVRSRQPKSIPNKFFSIDPKDFDKFRWIVQQNQYISSLSTYDKWTLFTYTSDGYLLANEYLLYKRVDKSLLYNAFPQYYYLTNRSLPAFTNNRFSILKSIANVEYTSTDWNYFDVSDAVASELVKLYIEDLTRIIANAPRNTNYVKLYRGVVLNASQMPKEAVMNLFMSTSIYLSKAEFFAGNLCCTYEFYVPPGMPMLYLQTISLYPSEDEILMIPNVRIKLRSTNNQGFYVYDVAAPIIE